jgi:hypothetical protein
MTRFVSMMEVGAGQQQIPFRNDRKKGKGKDGLTFVVPTLAT